MGALGLKLLECALDDCAKDGLLLGLSLSLSTEPCKGLPCDLLGSGERPNPKTKHNDIKK